MRGVLTAFWALALVVSLANGNWALAGVALIVGSLSGFWLMTALEARRNGRATP